MQQRVLSRKTAAKEDILVHGALLPGELPEQPPLSFCYGRNHNPACLFFFKISKIVLGSKGRGMLAETWQHVLSQITSTVTQPPFWHLKFRFLLEDNLRVTGLSSAR